MAKARSAAVTQAKLNMIIYGEPFTGKSTLAMQLAYFKRTDGKPFRVLYLDPESGSIDDYLESLEQNGVQLANIYIVYTQSLGEVRQYIGKVKNNEDFYELDDDGNETDDVVVDADGLPFRADAIVVDGATILNLTTKQGLVEFSKKRNKVKADKDGLIGDARLVKIEGAGMELKDYQTVNFKGQDLILDLMASGVHCITTARETDEKTQIKLPDGTTNSVSTGRKIPDGFKGMDYNAKTVIRTFSDKETGQICAYVNKDRTGIHKANEIVEDPTLLDWQSVIDKTASRGSFVLKNDLTKAVDVEQDIYSKEILGGVSNPTNESTVDNNTGLDTNELSTIKDKIVAKLKSLDPVKKADVRKLLNENGLPDAFKNVSDIAILNKVWEVVSK